MYEVVATNRFKKDLKLAIKRGLDISSIRWNSNNSSKWKSTSWKK